MWLILRWVRQRTEVFDDVHEVSAINPSTTFASNETHSFVRGLSIEPFAKDCATRKIDYRGSSRLLS